MLLSDGSHHRPFTQREIARSGTVDRVISLCYGSFSLLISEEMLAGIAPTTIVGAA
jgi:hypothetical protein